MIPFAIVVAICAPGADVGWPAFRGEGDSIAAVDSLPLKWSDDQGIAWTVELDGYGQSSPVVWNDRVFTTSARGDNKEELLVACHDVRSGRQLWHQVIKASQTVPVSDYVSRSAPTPAVDADRVYAFFESGDLIALDHDGKLLWQRSLLTEYGAYQGNHGLGSSPALHGDSLVVLVDHDGPSYVLAVNTADGKNRWKADRPSKVSWSSPIIAEMHKRPTVFVSSNGSAEAYDLRDGKRLWSHAGIDGNTVASPTIAGDLVIVGSSDAGQTVALRPRADGTVDTVWRTDDAATSFGSALVYRDQVYMINKAGIAFGLQLTDGKSLWTERLAGSCWASPTAAGDHVFFFGKDGVTTVVATGAEFQKIAENTLATEDRIYGVAAVRGAWLVRTGEKLICIGSPQP